MASCHGQRPLDDSAHSAAYLLPVIFRRSGGSGWFQVVPRFANSPSINLRRSVTICRRPEGADAGRAGRFEAENLLDEEAMKFISSSSQICSDAAKRPSERGSTTPALRPSHKPSASCFLGRSNLRREPRRAPNLNFFACCRILSSHFGSSGLFRRLAPDSFFLSMAKSSWRRGPEWRQPCL